MGFEFASRTDVGLRRKVNEDSMLVQPERGLWAIADGMGGHAAGDVASAKVIEALSGLPAAPSLDLFVGRAVTALQDTNRELIRLARSGLEQRTIGSTVVALAIDGPRFICFWAGDSRAYRVRGGQIERLTRDHSLVQDLVDAGLIEASEAETHPDAHVITRAVGAKDTLIVERLPGDVLSGDQFVLASDGLTRVVADEEILQAVTEMTPGRAVHSLVETVLARGAPDNVSIILAKRVPSHSRSAST